MGAKVSAGNAAGLTDAAGHYDISLAVGTYDVTASAYGYATKVATGVAVTDGATTTVDFALNAVPKVTISGTVKDGSGHGWPLYAKIVVDGVPGGPVWTDPATGHFHVDVASGAQYTLHVSANYPGYKPADLVVNAGTSDVSTDAALMVDADSCVAPGYTRHFNGLHESFDAAAAPAGWTVVNNTADGGWGFTEFKGDSHTERAIGPDNPAAACAACHARAKRDGVYSEFAS